MALNLQNLAQPTGKQQLSDEEKQKQRAKINQLQGLNNVGLSKGTVYGPDLVYQGPQRPGGASSKPEEIQPEQSKPDPKPSNGFAQLAQTIVNPLAGASGFIASKFSDGFGPTVKKIGAEILKVGGRQIGSLDLANTDKTLESFKFLEDLTGKESAVATQLKKNKDKMEEFVYQGTEEGTVERKFARAENLFDTATLAPLLFSGGASSSVTLPAKQVLFRTLGVSAYEGLTGYGLGYSMARKEGQSPEEAKKNAILFGALGSGLSLAAPVVMSGIGRILRKTGLKATTKTVEEALSNPRLLREGVEEVDDFIGLVQRTPDYRLQTLSEGISPVQARKTLTQIARTQAELIEAQVKREALKEGLQEATEKASQAGTKRLQKAIASFSKSVDDEARALVRTFDALSAVPTQVLRTVRDTSSLLPDDISAIVTERLAAFGDEVTEDNVGAFARTVQSIRDEVASVPKDSVPQEVSTTLQESFETLADALEKRLNLEPSQVDPIAFVRGQRSQELADAAQRASTQGREFASLAKKRAALEAQDAKINDLVKQGRRLALSPEAETLRRVAQSSMADMPLTSVISSNRRIVTPEIAEELGALKNIKARTAGIAGITDVNRIAQIAQGGKEGILTRLLINPMFDARASSVKQASIVSKQALDTVEKNFGMKVPRYIASNEPTALKKLASGQINRPYHTKATKVFYATEVAEFDDAGRFLKAIDPDTGQAIKLDEGEKNMIEYTRAFYDNYIDNKLNPVRIANGDKPIPKRKNYITHLQSISVAQKNGHSMFEANFDKVVDDDLVNRVQNSFRFAKQRKGDLDIEADPLLAMVNYAQAAEYDIAMNPIIARANTILPYLKPNTREFVKQLKDERLAGGGFAVDRMFDKTGLPIANMAHKLRKRVGRGLIAFNLNTVFLQPSTVLASVPYVGLKPFIKGSQMMMTKEGRAFITSKSRMLAIRDLDTLGFAKAGSVTRLASLPATALDREMVMLSWSAGYQKARALGYKGPRAVEFADDLAAKTNVIYDKLFAPRAIASKVGGAAFQFQDFPVNLYNQFRRDIPMALKEEGVGSAVKLGAGLWASMKLMNAVYEAAGFQTPYEFASDEGDPTELVPLVGGVSKFGFSPVPTLVIGVASLFMGSEEQKASALKKLKRLVPALTVTGGNQLRKTLEGMEALSKGYYEAAGQKIPLTTAHDVFNSLTTGPSQAPSVSEYFDDYRELKESREKAKEQAKKQAGDVAERFKQSN